MISSFTGPGRHHVHFSNFILFCLDLFCVGKWFQTHFIHVSVRNALSLSYHFFDVIQDATEKQRAK